MRKVLIVEPKAADARALKHAMHEAGLTNASIVVKTGAEARRQLALSAPDCIVLLNVHAPESEGMAFLDWLREQGWCKEILVVAVGERTDLRSVVDACERGAQTFVIKPVHVEDLKTLARTYPDHWGRPPA